MVSLPKYRIKVPATSANLGPGFDLMGMSLDLHNEFEFVFAGKKEFQSFRKNGEPLPFSESDDLVLTSYKKYFQDLTKIESPPYYSCKMNLGLPLKGGLGSSASAIVAGLSLAHEVHKRLSPKSDIPSHKKFLQYLAEFEGHPDNTLPAYLGGFVFAYSVFGEDIRYFRKKFPNSVSVFVLTPKFHVSTEESRKTLPKTYPTNDLIFNLSRIGAWMHFLDKRRFSDLVVALEDRMHTPYRIPNDSPVASLLGELKTMRLGTCLSGSGPSVLIFVERKQIKILAPKITDLVAQKMDEANIEYDLKQVHTDHLGVQIKTF
ncbi:MAG: homoserine kinase [Leptospira sp.]|nr:homoserine kinase [Leptospira sp.]